MVLNEFIAFAQLGPLKDDARSAVVHHRDVRAVRLREFRVDRHADRRHRRAGADAPRRSGAAGPARDARGHARQFRDARSSWACCCERIRITSDAEAAELAAGNARLRRRATSPIVLGSGLGDFADQLGDASAMPYGEIPHWPASRVVGHAGKLVVRHGRADARAGAVGPRASLRRPRPADGDLCDARDGRLGVPR